MSVLNRFPALRRLSAASLALPALVCVASAPVWAQVAAPRAVNIVNDKFATVSSGTQSAIHVAVPDNASPAETRAAIIKSLKANWRAQGAALSRSAESYKKAGLLKGGVIPISTIIQVEKNGKPLTRAVDRTRAVGNGTLTFTYTGWSDQRRKQIQDYIAAFTTSIEEVYGKPAESGNVDIENVNFFEDSTIPDVQRIFAYGGYAPATATTPAKIYLPQFVSDQQFAQALLLNLLHAYHGSAVFRYDAWEQGFARAAAVVIARQDRFGFNDPNISNFFSLLEWYDLFNQPGLGNPTFFPPSQKNINLETTAGSATLGKMTFARVGMSGAAWLKAYIENPNFFRDFNARYYEQYEAQLAGNVPALKSIAASIVPNVEGDPFEQWFRKQYILDTSVSQGRKLYAYVFPGIYQNDKQASLVQLVYFNTKSDGDEDLLDGRVYATYHDADGATVNLGAASESVDLVDGDGSITTQTFVPNEGRLTMDFAVRAETARVYMPSGFSGDFQGVILGNTGNGRDITVTQTTSQTNREQKTQSAKGAFAVTLGGGGFDLSKTRIEYTDGTGTRRTFFRNTGHGQSYVVLTPDQNSGSVQTVTRTFDRANIPYFVSFPVLPQITNVPNALGLSQNDFVLTYWDPFDRKPIAATADPTTSLVGSIAPGRGYWFKVQPENRQAGNVTVSMTGVAPVTDVDLAVAARYGWNMIGSPFTGSTTRLEDIQVQYLQNAPVYWADAVANNYVAATPYRFDRLNGTFAEADQINAPEWEALYFRVLVPGSVTILLPAPDVATRSVVLRKGRSVSADAPRPDWAVTLRASQKPDETTGSFARTAAVKFGTAKSATDKYDNLLDREQPPSIVSGVELGFDAPSGTTNAAGGRYVADFRSNGSRKAQWSFTSYAAVTGPVRLEWNNIGSVPRNTTLMLTDTETGEKIPLRSRSAYTWQATDGKKTRKFTITSEAARTTPLLLTNVMVTRASGGTRAQGGRSYAISYSVTGDARVTVEMAAINGKVVRRLDNGSRAISGGRQTLIWDGRAENNSTLPAGTYTMRITATAEDGNGTPVTIIRPVMVLN